MTQVLIHPFWQVFDNNGNPAAGAKFFAKDAGTSTPKTVYSDYTLITPFTQPVLADGNGRFPTVYGGDGDYKVKVTDSTGGVGLPGVDLFPEVDNWTILANLTQTTLSFPTATKTTNYTVVAADRGKVLEFDAAGATLIATLNATTLGNGFPVWIVNTGATGTIQLQFGGGETLLGAATYNLTNQYQAIGLVSRGAAGWDLIAAYGFNFDTLITFNQGLNVASGKPATFSGPTIFPYITLTDAATIAWDLSLGTNFKVTLTANRVFGAPTSLVEGQSGELLVIQNATGGWVPTWTAPITFDGGPPNPKTAASSRTFYRYKVENSLVVLTRADDIVLTQATEAVTTAGTSIDFTGIPAGVKRVTVMLDGVSTNGTSNLLVQIGDSGGIETATYNSAAQSGGTVSTSTAGFIITATNGATSISFGAIILILQDGSNTWIAQGIIYRSVGGDVNVSAGSKATSATLDRVRLTTVNGTDTFDLGSMNILYE